MTYVEQGEVIGLDHVTGSGIGQAVSLAQLGVTVQGPITKLSLLNVGSTNIRVGLNTANPASYLLPPYVGVTMNVGQSGALRLRLFMALGDSYALNVQQEGD